MLAETIGFSAPLAIRLADTILAKPPSRDFIRRPELAPHIIFRAALPAELCKEANATSRRAYAGANWAFASTKNRIWELLEGQSIAWRQRGIPWPVELDHGRPQVIAIKFSSHPNDEGSNPAKAAIDMLTCRKLLDKKRSKYTAHRLGIIKDDRRSEVDQYHWWEFLPRKYAAFVLIEVRCP